MATCVWRGDAPAVAKVITVTVGGTVEATDVFKMTIGTKTLTVVAGSTTPATVASTIVSAWNALSATEYPEFAEITAAAVSGGDFTLTADTAGVDFSVTLATTETGGGAADDQTFTQSTTTANSGPNDWSVAANWSGGAVPVNSDDVVFENSDVDCLYGLAQSGVTLTSLTVRLSYTGRIGLPRENASGYIEYRERYLCIGATTATFFDDGGDGSGRVLLNTGSVQTSLNVNGTGSALETGIPSLCWKGTHASNVVNVTKGSVGIAQFGGELATVATLTVGQESGEEDAEVECGAGVTLTTVTNRGGTVWIDTTAAAMTTVTNLAGTLTIDGKTNAITTLRVFGGTVYSNTSATVTNLYVSSGGILDYGRDQRTKTVTNAFLYAGATIRDPAQLVTWSNGLDLIGCGLEDVTLDAGKHRTWTPSAI